MQFGANLIFESLEPGLDLDGMMGKLARRLAATLASAMTLHLLVTGWLPFREPDCRFRSVNRIDPGLVPSQ